MPHWLLKWAVQRTIAVLPHRQRFNELFQKYFTRTLELGPGMFERRLEHCRIHYENFRSFAGPGSSFRALELGAGWYPTIAVGLYLCGAEGVWLFDIDPLLKRERLVRMMDLFVQLQERGKLATCLPAIDQKRFENLCENRNRLEEESAEKWLSRFNIQVMIKDVRQSGLPAGSIDFFYTTSVLEYISLPVLCGILKEFQRLESSRSVMSHWVGLLDQYSFFDKTLSPFDYLKYTDAQWKRWQSPLTPQSRLMIPQYRELFSEAGYQIVKEAGVRGTDRDFDRVKLAPQFQKYDREDLIQLGFWMVCKPRGAQAAGTNMTRLE